MYQYNVGPTLTPLSGAAEETACGLLLTEPSPNDSHHIPPDRKHPFGCDHGDRAAAEDTTREVRSLRRRGVRVAAVFMGEDLSVPGAEEIYEKNLVRIRSMGQPAGAAGALIRRKIQELFD